MYIINIILDNFKLVLAAAGVIIMYYDLISLTCNDFTAQFSNKPQKESQSKITKSFNVKLHHSGKQKNATTVVTDKFRLPASICLENSGNFDTNSMESDNNKTTINKDMTVTLNKKTNI